MSFLYDLALAHQKHEGFYPPGVHPSYPQGSIAYRHNNPGNLRWHPGHKAFGGKYHPKFTIFPSYELGLQALMADLRAKITGHSAHINYSRNPTFLTYVRVYAPSDDGNSPSGYTQALIHDLAAKGYSLSPDTPLSELARMVAGEEINPPMVFSASAQLKRLTRAVNRSTGQLKEMLARQLERLLDRIR